MIWTCPDCGTDYTCLQPMIYCPKCAEREQMVIKARSQEILDGMRSIANDIVGQTLAKNGALHGQIMTERS